MDVVSVINVVTNVASVNIGCFCNFTQTDEHTQCMLCIKKKIRQSKVANAFIDPDTTEEG